jgi:hypothetical protein
MMTSANQQIQFFSPRALGLGLTKPITKHTWLLLSKERTLLPSVCSTSLSLCLSVYLSARSFVRSEDQVRFLSNSGGICGGRTGTSIFPWQLSFQHCFILLYSEGLVQLAYSWTVMQEVGSEKPLIKRVS